jgi:hypothetical protein
MAATLQNPWKQIPGDDVVRHLLGALVRKEREGSFAA